ncbi:Plant intracellular Ras-group-related LRR protein 3 [Morella rubra]|uniref:Plant intracellular Ras-group-related LRR protein 3 n=1 Tax=Morella rubra TaxID=262757 RepID=A0A6A1V4T8_9ROSI|nr:Plant intracellular Ras-group-related LRR protein 3 [Morella rubra]
MDPNPKDYPILSYLLSQLNPEPHEDPPIPQQLLETLLTQLPYLNHPKLQAALAQAIPDIKQTQSLLRNLGPRPDPYAVAIARAKLSEIQSKLQKNLQETEAHAMVNGVVDRAQKEKELIEVAETEMQIYKAVVRLEEMHEVYEKRLREAEDRLVEVYGSIVAEVEREQQGTNEEVVGILKDAENGIVERVELSGRQLRFLPEAFGKLQWLVVLNLSHNQLEVLPDSIAGLQKLEELDVSSNLLVSLPDSIGLLLNLRVLNVSGNKITTLPETISRCSCLVELDASFNNLICLPSNIGYGLVNLERLSIQLNRLRCLPPSIGELRSLRYLDVHFNELRGLPYSIGRLTNLEVLNLSSNFSDLTAIPETIGDLINLRELDLSNNQIRALPNSFGELKNLAKLNLDQNPLEIPPIEIVNQGVEAVKEFMAKRLLDARAEEEQRNMLEVNKQQAQTGLLAWGTSLLNSVVLGFHKVLQALLEPEKLQETHGWINNCNSIISLTWFSERISRSFKMATATEPQLALAPNFILPKDKRPQLSQITSLASIPIIDLNDEDIKTGGRGSSSLLEKISQACEEYGFFQIINHGVPEELCDKVMTATTEFFELPPEERAEFFSEDPSKQVRLFNYYLKVEGQEKVTMWSENFSHPWHPVDDFFAHQLPKNPPNYREAFVEYAKEVGALVDRLFSLLSQALGLEKDCLQKGLGDAPIRKTQAIFYPPCPNPELTLGLAVHTDSFALTVLRQSAGVTGLQVIKDEKWVAVDPVPNAFVINLGDQLQVMSNGRFKSVHHRAVTNKLLPRVSLAVFYGPNYDTVICPVEDLIDEEHPPLYRSYTFKEFMEEFHRQEGTRRRVKEAFELPR